MTDEQREALVAHWLEAELDEAEDARTLHGYVSDDYREGVWLIRRKSKARLLPDGPVSITSSSKTAGAGGIGSMHRMIRCSKGWRRKHERPSGDCGLILLLSRRGSTGE